MPYHVLPSHHYASKWSQDNEIRDFKSVTDLGVRYVNEKNPTKKEEMLLKLVRYFHSYLFKYVGMIVSGTLPKTGNAINKDAKTMLRFFLPKGANTTGFGFCRMLSGTVGSADADAQAEVIAGGVHQVLPDPQIAFRGEDRRVPQR